MSKVYNNEIGYANFIATSYVNTPTKGPIKPYPKRPRSKETKAHDRSRKATKKPFQGHIRPIVNHPKSIGGQ